MEGDTLSGDNDQKEANTKDVVPDGNLKFCYPAVCQAPRPPHGFPERHEMHDEQQYLDQLRYILDHGILKEDRTGVGTISVFGMQSRYSLRGGTVLQLHFRLVADVGGVCCGGKGVFPLMTTKRVFWKAVAEELLWFVRGSTNGKELTEKNVHIWDANGARQYLDSIGLEKNQEGDLGPVYGFQWRHFGAEYTDCHGDYSERGIDQLKLIIDTLIKNPIDRRMILCAWNPADLHKMALPPCHAFAQFYVAKGELSCQLYQRSADMGLGVPFNIASYALLTCMIAHVTNLKPGEFIHTLGDAHIYMNHVDVLKEQLLRSPRPFPDLDIRRRVNNIDDFRFEDFLITGYNPHGPLKLSMAV